MSLIPLNPPDIVRNYGCAETATPGSGEREGPEIWQGRCAGFMVHSWPNVNQTLEIIDKNLNETMSLIPVPGKPILFGTVKSVQLRTTFRIGLLVSWRIVLEAFTDPIYAMVGMSAHGNAQWLPVARNRDVANGVDFEFEFYAWEDGILRYAFNRSAGAWLADLQSRCTGGSDFFVINTIDITNAWEKDWPNARVTKGRFYVLTISHDQEAPASFNMDIGIIKDPIDQT